MSSRYRPPHKRRGESTGRSNPNTSEENSTDSSTKGAIPKQSRFGGKNQNKRDHSANRRVNESDANFNKRRSQKEPRSDWRSKNDEDKSKQKRSNDNNDLKLYEPRPNKLKRMTFTRMEQLLTEDPNTICIVLQNKDEGFLTLLEHDQHMIKDDWIILIIKLLEQVISSTIDMKRLIIIDSCNHFIPILIKYLLNLPFQSRSERDRNKHYWQNSKSFWSALIKLCNEIIMIIPKTAVDQLPKLLAVMEMAVTTLGHSPESRLNENIINEMDQLNEKLTILISTRESKNVNDEEESEEEEMPFGDYRDIPIVPEQHELVAVKGPEIRPNIINGKYISVYHYLDVQFRLLREDFVAPLRNGIRNYLSPDPNNKKRYESIRIYKKVQITGTTITKQQQFCFVVKLNLQPRQLERLEHSKRLMFGSLLIFTNDSFQTIIVGTMFQKDEKTLSNSEILVDIPLNSINMETCFNTDYTMVESEIYFEPYRHILKTLQQMTEESFPMPNYILKADVTSKPPRYLTEGSTVKIKDNFYEILDENSWTILTPEKLKYDTTQYEAFKAALTKEFCVIQGPPGTGKTFIGLEIIETFLVNNNLWYNKENKNSGPILVVCYTNHALDQFLEGVLKITNRVARIGGQSKNQKLNEFNIKELRKSVRRDQNFQRAAVTLHIELNDILKTIHELRSVLQIIYFREPFLLDIRSELAKRRIRFSTKNEFENWILCRTNHNEVRAEERLILQIMGGGDIDNLDDEVDNNVPIDDPVMDYDDLDDYSIGIVKDLNADKQKLQQLLIIYDEALTEKQPKNFDEIREIRRIEQQIRQYETYVRYLEFRLHQNLNQLPVPPQFIRNPDQLTTNQRWALYWNCLERTSKRLIQRIKDLQMEYNNKLKDYNIVQQMEDLIVLRDCMVVGMTTTGAAKFRTVLEGLRSPIVIVEEAAEVLESHIVTSLTPNCKHLILIGDHKQLRPSTSVYRLAKDFNLDISLFERIIKNGMQYESLGVQHRMRPEFAQLIVPSIYPNLQNHWSVLSYPQITGMKKNLFFIKHTNFEETVADIDSKQNIHEAEFMLQLCRHLILQGYDAEDITVLTTYNGQMFTMKRLQRNIPTIKDVRITVVDNFQGEESNIILLSLVRSNEENKIGFLATENRICVALSRAKHGFYIIGNMDQLVSNSNSKWPKINEVLERNTSIGTDLVLQCKIHKDQETYVKCAEDFRRMCPEGGCALPCNLIMPCGHQCASMCHVQDRDHTETKCLMPCSRIICEREHQCPDLCFRKCEKCMKLVEHILPCSHKASLHCYMDPNQYKCQEIITVKLDCEHENKIRCSDDPKTALCSHPCATRLDCGHTCVKRCHINNDPDHEKYECRKPCEQLMVKCSMDHKCDKQCYEECNLCNIVVEKKHSTCEHSQKVKCYQNIDEISCDKKCTRKMNCGHRCINLCGELCDQSKCKIQVQKVVPLCGHTLKVECGKPPERKYCKRKCPLKLPCGHVCNNRCDRCDSQGCSKAKCQTLVEHSFSVDCNHKFQIPCFKTNIPDLKNYSQDLLKHCNNPCNYELECKHLCTGTCGECFQGRLHKPCESKCGLTLVCGHPCQSPCRENCPPCMAKCQFRCKHSQCKKQCGEPCTPCKEQCQWRCIHLVCTKKCGEICNREPCNEPCSKLLPCGHQCIGLCGEICPEVCRVCDPQNEVFVVFFGDEDEETSRFIKLEDCGHILEVNGLETFFKMTNEGNGDTSVDIIKCPRCRQPVIQTLRYSTLIKEKFMDIINVKRRIFGDRKNNIQNAYILRDIKIPEILTKDNGILFQCGLLKILQNCRTQLKPTHEKRKNYKNVKVTAMQLSLFDYQIGIIELIVNHLLKIRQYHDYTTEMFTIGINHASLIATFLERQYNKLNQQQRNDLRLETNRLVRICEFAVLLSTDEYKTNRLNTVIIIQKNKVLNCILASKKFTLEYDYTVRQNLLEFEKLLKRHGGISNEVKQDIVRALQTADGVRQGAWYKCPNGHYYVIGECGGAMQVGKCIECKAEVGGSSHRILSTNRHASEMDGGRLLW